MRPYILILLLLLPAPLRAETAPATLPRAQFIADMDGQFRKIDTNKDGQLTAAEVAAYQNAAAAGLVQARQRAAFAALDTDRNGQLSPAEFAKIPVTTPTANPTTIMRFDTGRDGRVSLIEHRTATLANFDRLDTDKDGNVSPAEMKAGGIAPR